MEGGADGAEDARSGEMGRMARIEAPMPAVKMRSEERTLLLKAGSDIRFSVSRSV